MDKGYLCLSKIFLFVAFTLIIYLFYVTVKKVIINKFIYTCTYFIFKQFYFFM